MKILALDSAAAGCNVCVWQDGKVLALKTESMMRGQDARLVPLVEEVMAEAKMTYADLDRIAVTRGPGSFTGLRVGLATARGIGLAAEKPVVGIDRFSIYGKMFEKRDSTFLVVLESRRLELFIKTLKPSDTAPFNPEESEMLPPDEIKASCDADPDCMIVGDKPASLAALIDADRFLEPSQDEVIACAELAASAEAGTEHVLPRPLYLRAPDVTMPKKAF